MDGTSKKMCLEVTIMALPWTQVSNSRQSAEPERAGDETWCCSFGNEIAL